MHSIFKLIHHRSILAALLLIAWTGLVPMGGASIAPALAEANVRVGHFQLPRQRGLIHAAFGDQDVLLLMAAFDSMTYLNEDSSVAPGLAVSWRAEGKDAWILSLRRGVRFHSDRDFTGQDLVWNIEYILSPEGKTGSAARNFGRTIAGARLIDDYTVEIKTNTPNPILDRWLSLMRVMDPKHWKDVGKDGFAANPVGTGSFRVTNWTSDRVDLARSPVAWRPPKIDGIEIIELPEPTARTQALISRQVEIAWGVNADDISQIKASGAKVFISPSHDVLGYAFNVLGGGPIADVRVRRALNYGVNKQDFIDNVLHGLGQPASQPSSRDMLGHNPNLKSYPYDPERAKALLSEAGYGDGLKIKAEIVTTIAGIKDAFEHMSSDLSRIGVELEIVNLAVPAFIKKFFGQQPWESDGLSSLYNGFPTADAMRPLETHSCLGRANYICEKAIQPSIDAANEEFDSGKRKDLMWKVMEYYHDQALALYMHETAKIDGLAPGISSYRLFNRTVNWHEIGFDG